LKVLKDAQLVVVRGSPFLSWRSDARIIMGDDEDALVRLCQEKRGEADPEDLSGNFSLVNS
jgi:hypothetical protein